VAAFRANIDAIVIAKLSGNLRAVPAPINEFFADQDSVSLGIVPYVRDVARAVSKLW
jgi:hypothetical protein